MSVYDSDVVCCYTSKRAEAALAAAVSRVTSTAPPGVYSPAGIQAWALQDPQCEIITCARLCLDDGWVGVVLTTDKQFIVFHTRGNGKDCVYARFSAARVQLDVEGIIELLATCSDYRSPVVYCSLSFAARMIPVPFDQAGSDACTDTKHVESARIGPAAGGASGGAAGGAAAGAADDCSSVFALAGDTAESGTLEAEEWFAVLYSTIEAEVGGCVFSSPHCIIKWPEQGAWMAVVFGTRRNGNVVVSFNRDTRTVFVTNNGGNREALHPEDVQRLVGFLCQGSPWRGYELGPILPGVDSQLEALQRRNCFEDVVQPQGACAEYKPMQAGLLDAEDIVFGDIEDADEYARGVHCDQSYGRTVHGVNDGASYEQGALFDALYVLAQCFVLPPDADQLTFAFVFAKGGAPTLWCFPPSPVTMAKGVTADGTCRFVMTLTTHGPKLYYWDIADQCVYSVTQYRVSKCVSAALAFELSESIDTPRRLTLEQYQRHTEERVASATQLETYAAFACIDTLLSAFFTALQRPESRRSLLAQRTSFTHWFGFVMRLLYDRALDETRVADTLALLNSVLDACEQLEARAQQHRAVQAATGAVVAAPDSVVVDVGVGSGASADGVDVRSTADSKCGDGALPGAAGSAV